MKDVCEVTQIHPEAVENVIRFMPDLRAVASLFKALADDTRLNIAYALTIEKEMCVCDVAAVIGSSTATASHHLRYLKDRGLTSSVRKGKQVYYSLADDHVHQLVTIAHEHAKEGEPNAKDLSS
ncbi:ArsR/SmtB family transcription factor [Planococcus salinus]|uniref:Transcriptional regulator n=1 Tax=Planococcus salinus TaxID=1848460 RepID=A0A3M8P5T6_9BACL|nr:metalloregulator ArsR/SmtB family transcription factor [Planococcus salinus]RNF38584.1 transcriptional regulator [Planococcus salinus]